MRHAFSGTIPAGGLTTHALLGMLTAISVTGVMMTSDAFWGTQWVEDLRSSAPIRS